MADGKLRDATYLRGKPCPKCAYVRTFTDTSPDWQCPRCGIAYLKYRAAAPLAKRISGTSRELAAEAGTDRSAYGLVAANLFTFWIAISEGLSVRELMYIYWVQTILIGISFLIRIVLLGSRASPSLEAGAEKVSVILQMVLFLAIFLGFYRWVLFDPSQFMHRILGGVPGPAQRYMLCFLAFAAAHGYSLLRNVARDSESKEHPEMLAAIPLLRIVPMHLTILAPCIMSGPALLYVFVGLKTAADVITHTIEHRLLRLGHLEEPE